MKYILSQMSIGESSSESINESTTQSLDIALLDYIARAEKAEHDEAENKLVSEVKTGRKDVIIISDESSSHSSPEESSSHSSSSENDEMIVGHVFLIAGRKTEVDVVSSKITALLEQSGLIPYEYDSSSDQGQKESLVKEFSDNVPGSDANAIMNGLDLFEAGIKREYGEKIEALVAEEVPAEEVEVLDAMDIDQQESQEEVQEESQEDSSSSKSLKRKRDEFVGYIGWYGRLCRDDRPRLFQDSPKDKQGKVYKGRLIESYKVPELIEIAWSLGITNHLGTDSKCSLGDYQRYHNFYPEGWKKVKKQDLINTIWNYLLDHNRILVD